MKAVLFFWFMGLMAAMFNFQFVVFGLWSMHFDWGRIAHSFGKKGFFKELRDELERNTQELDPEGYFQACRWLVLPWWAASWIVYFQIHHS